MQNVFVRVVFWGKELLHSWFNCSFKVYGEWCSQLLLELRTMTPICSNSLETIAELAEENCPHLSTLRLRDNDQLIGESILS